MAVRLYIKADGKRNSPHLCYAFDQVGCSKTEFCSNHKGHIGVKTGVGVVQVNHFFARHFYFILGNRKVEKFYVDIYYIIS